MSSFILYVVGFLILIGGVIYAAATLGVSAQWIIVIAAVLGGIGIVSGVVTTRKKDETEAS